MSENNHHLPMNHPDAKSTFELSEESQLKVNELVKTIDMADSQSVMAYGSAAQKNVSTFSDTVLKNVNANEFGEVGDMVTDLLLQLKTVDTKKLLDKPSFLSKVPLIGNAFNHLKKTLLHFESVEKHVEKTVKKLSETNTNLLQDIGMLDRLFEENANQRIEFEIFIRAGELAIQQARTEELPTLENKAKETNDQHDLAVFQDKARLVERFEKKIHNLHLSRHKTITTGPQIRFIQHNNELLVEKIGDIANHVIPEWKKQLVITTALFKQTKGVEIARKIREHYDELAKKNAELLKQASIEIATENERGIFEIETLRHVQQNFIETLEETIRIQKEGKHKRKEVSEELVSLENDLKRKAIELAQEAYREN